jgi:hypothetical protein
MNYEKTGLRLHIETSKEEMEDLIRFYRENPDHVGKFVSDGSEISFGGNDE